RAEARDGTSRESASPPQQRRSTGGSGPSLRSLLLVLLFGGGLLAVAAYFFLSRRRRRAKARAAEEIERWQGKIGNAAERLLAMENKYPLYFSTRNLRWDGESEDLDQACADAVNRVYLLYSKAFELLRSAEHDVAHARGFGAEPFDKAFTSLRETPVRFDTGEPPPDTPDHRRIFRPLTEHYEGTAHSLLEDLDGAYGNALEALDRVTEVDQRFRDRVEAADGAATAATAACSRRGELGLPTAPGTDRLAPLLDGRDRAASLLSDPVRAVRLLDATTADLSELAEVVELGNSTIDELRGPITELGLHLRRRLDELRGAGFRCAEPGFQPDLRLDRGLEEAELVERSVAEGREAEGAEHLGSLRSGLGELEEQLLAVEGARDGVPPAVARVEADAAALRDRIPAARVTLEGLAEDHAAEAYGAEADNLEELDDILGQIGEWTDHIREDHGSQRYLSALADLDTCATLVADGAALLDAVDTIQRTLDEARGIAVAGVQTCRDLQDRVRGLASEAGVARDLSERCGVAVQDADELFGKADAPRPNWLTLEADLEAMGAALRHLASEAEADIADLAQCRTLETELAERADGLLRRARTERRDRDHVERAIRDAAAKIESWRSDLASDGASGGAGSGGRQLLHRGRDAEQSLAHAAELWSSEADAIATAERELATAEALLRQEDGRSHGYGVVVDCQRGRRLLADARDAAAGKAWESVADLARKAAEAVREEAGAAHRAAREREQAERLRLAQLRAQEEARRRAAAAAAAAAAARSRSWSTSTSSSSSFGTSRRSRPSRRPRPPRRSRSGGSSFGRSRSGGSRW
ncbi:MAG: hypothetical protein AAGD06_28770, partial [Acidobacteriota bacterium]